MDFNGYIKAELLILVPVLFFIGKALKQSPFPDRWIPLALGFCGILLASLYVFAACFSEDGGKVLIALFAALTQGIMSAGASVYVHQLAKQAHKRD